MNDKSDILLSLCVPTYGVCEWVFPVLDSIYSQNADLSLFEVVVTDNGSNKEFQERVVNEYKTRYSNFVYRQTNAKLFLNEIESYKLAKGKFIKFVNHRTLLETGAIDYLIDFVKKNEKEKPFVYFADGVLPKFKYGEYVSFDDFVKNLRIWNSWSTGMGFWKEDFNCIPENQTYNELFPHTTILYSQRHKTKYIIDNTLLMTEMKTDSSKKGSYDVYYAFAVEYIGILLDLLRSGDISMDTFLYLKRDALKFISNLYYEFNFLKRPCSYEINNFKNVIPIFYSPRKILVIKILSLFYMIKSFIRRIGKMLLLKNATSFDGTKAHDKPNKCISNTCIGGGVNEPPFQISTSSEAA